MGAGETGAAPAAADGAFRIGIYDAYLHTLGGGENLLAVLAQCLERRIPGARIDLVAHQEAPETIAPIVARFGVDLRRTRVRRLDLPRRAWLSRLHLVRRLLHERDVARVSAEYDLFVNGTIFSLVPPRSPHSLYVCMFPLAPVPATWARAPRPLRLLAAPYLAARGWAIRSLAARYDLVLSISEFTRRWVREFWGLESRVVFPPVDTAPAVDLAGKRRRILSIGRFFPGDHNKKHDVLIDAFARLRERGAADGWELHLAGGRTDVPGTDDYLRKLRRMAEGLDVHLHVDASRDLLDGLLATSSLYWHATGYGEDETRDPYKLEHFGISTVEAMSHGCVPLVYAAGGQPEVVVDGESGFLWRDLPTLLERTAELAADPARREAMAGAAHLRSRTFGRAAFEARIASLLDDLLPGEVARPAAETPVPLPAGPVASR